MAADRDPDAESSEWAGFSERGDGEGEGDDDMDFEVSERASERFPPFFFLERCGAALRDGGGPDC